MPISTHGASSGGPFAREAVASAGLVLGGALWGLFWLPVRAAGEMGLEGAWPGMLIYAATALILLPLAIVRRRRIGAEWRRLIVCGLFTGAAFSLYSTAILLTEVVRVILLFYLTPVWGTLLGLTLLGERLTRARVAALTLGLAGLYVVLGGEGVPWPRNLGDWLALGSGLAWAYGSLSLYRMGGAAVPDQILAFVGGSLLVTALTLLLGGPAFGAAPSAALALEASPWALLTGLYVAPMLLLTVWPATMLTPGRVGLLLMSDVLVGVVSAALWAGEPFGLRESLGAALIVAAGLVEVLGRGEGMPARADA